MARHNREPPGQKPRPMLRTVPSAVSPTRRRPGQLLTQSDVGHVYEDHEEAERCGAALGDAPEQVRLDEIRPAGAARRAMMIPASIGAREESSHVATAQPAVKLTYEDYCAAPADNRYELLDGELIMVAAPNIKHESVRSLLGHHLSNFIIDHGLGKLFYAPCDVMLSESDVVQPDLLFVSREREHLLRDGQKVQGAPDLVIEIILSPSTADRDRGKKLALYGRHGVTEYWLVDPVAETIQIHRLQGEILVPTRTFGREETLRSALLVGLELRLDDIFSS